MTHCTRLFLGIFLALGSLNILAAPESGAQTIECKPIDMSTEFIMCSGPDRGPEHLSTAIVSFYQLWVPKHNLQTVAQHQKLLKELIWQKPEEPKTLSVKIQNLNKTREERHHSDVGTFYLDGKDIGLELLKAGLAVTWPTQAWPENPEYIVAQKQAQQQKAGLWGDPSSASILSQTKDVTLENLPDAQWKKAEALDKMMPAFCKDTLALCPAIAIGVLKALYDSSQD
ncbi:MAG: thermonuclease family protein [Burkholderiaceae bacterium]|jgi:hypothetical protein|nr:thermonuclease family protein [Burkholderiaceae bacterium]